MNSVTMDETTEMPGAGVDPEVTAYVGLVRIALRDLAPEDLEDLTGGQIWPSWPQSRRNLIARRANPLIRRLGRRGCPIGRRDQSRGWALLRVCAAGGGRPAGTTCQWLRPVWWVLRGPCSPGSPCSSSGFGAASRCPHRRGCRSGRAASDRWTAGASVSSRRGIAAVVMTLRSFGVTHGGRTTYVEVCEEGI